MSLIRTFSGRRYRVAGTLPSPYAEEFHRRLTDRRFLPLTAREEATHGWVTAENLLLTEFDVDTVVRGEHATFALRLDRRRVNPRMLRAQLDLELRGQRKAAEDAGTPFRISRDERSRLRADLKDQLLLDTNPTVQVCPVLYHSKRRVLHVLSLAKAMNGLVVKAFEETFAARLVPLTPWHRSQEILAGTEAADRLGGLERTRFTGNPLGLGLRDGASADTPPDAPSPTADVVRRLPDAATTEAGTMEGDR